MSRLLDVNLHPDAATLRRFGFIACVAFGALAFRAARGGFPFSAALPRQAVIALAAVASLSALFSLVSPRLNRGLYVTLIIVSYPVGVVVSYAMLIVVFFGVIAPTGALLRLLGKEPLRRKAEPSLPSYWVSVRRPRPKESYFRRY